MERMESGPAVSGLSGGFEGMSATAQYQAQMQHMLMQQQQHHQQQLQGMVAGGMQAHSAYSASAPMRGANMQDLHPGNANMNRMHASLQAAHHSALLQSKDGVQNLHLNVSQGVAMHGGMHLNQQHPHLAAGAGIQPYGSPMQSHGAWRASDGGGFGSKPKSQNTAPGAYAGANGTVRQQDVGKTRSGPQPGASVDEQQSAAPQASTARMYSVRAMEAAEPPAADRCRSTRHSVVLPSYASWFEMGQVHDIERQALPDLTSSAEAISCYISLRDRMISLYRDVPGRPLHAVDCLRHLASDPGTLLRVHAFLDFWGIINTDAQGRVRFQKALRMLAEPPPPQRGSGRAASGGKDSNKQVSRGYGHCAVTGEPLQRLCYALKTDPKYMLSPTAYVLGLMPRHLAPSDFVRRVNDEKTLQSFPTHDDWTEDETKDMLDALSRVGEEWDVVAQMVRTKSMEQCVLHFARLPIADRYLLDVNPGFEDEHLLKLPVLSTQSASLAPALASSAFPDEWSPEWTRWLKNMVSIDPREAAALGPALSASMAAVDGILEQTEGDANGQALNVTDGDRQRSSHASRAGAAAPDEPCDWDGEARPSADHPWMSVLEWPAPSGLPRAKNLKEGDCVLLLSDEVGRFRRGRVHTVHSAKTGVMSVDICAGHGVKVLQLSCLQYRVLTSDEVATIERTIGCSFMAMSVAEKEHERDAAEGDASSEVPVVLPVKAVAAPSAVDRARGRGDSQDAAASSALMVDVAGEPHAGDEQNGAAPAAGRACQRPQSAQDSVVVREGTCSSRHNVWDETGAPKVRVVEDLPALRQVVECAKEVEDEAQVRDATLRVVQAKIAKTALRLYNAELADRALLELRESIRSRQRELLTEKRKTHTPQYRPKQGSRCVLSMMCDDDDEETRRLKAVYGGGRETLGRAAKSGGRVYDYDDPDIEDE